MTPAEQEEWDYIYNERLAILGFYGVAPKELHELAKRDADEAVEKLKQQNINERNTP